MDWKMLMLQRIVRLLAEAPEWEWALSLLKLVSELAWEGLGL